MNSPQVRTWAKSFAQRLEKESKVKNLDDLAPLIQRA